MLVGTDGVGGGLETPIALGANDSRVPTGPLFFQYPEQRHFVAAGMAGVLSVQNGFGTRRWLLARADPCGLGPTAPANQETSAGSLRGTGAVEGRASDGDLAAGIFGEPRGMAGGTYAASPRRYAGPGLNCYFFGASRAYR